MRLSESQLRRKVQQIIREMAPPPPVSGTVFAVLGDLDEMSEDTQVSPAELRRFLMSAGAKVGATVLIDTQPGHMRSIEVTAPSEKQIIDLGAAIHNQFYPGQSFSVIDFLDSIGEIEQV